MCVKKRIFLHCKAVKQVLKFFLYTVKEFFFTLIQFQISVKNVKQCKAQYKYKYKYKFIAHFYTLPFGQTGKIASLGAGTNVPTPANFFYAEVFEIWIENAGMGRGRLQKIIIENYRILYKIIEKLYKIGQNCGVDVRSVSSTQSAH